MGRINFTENEVIEFVEIHAEPRVVTQNKYKGVYVQGNGFRAQIQMNGKQVYLGYFNNEISAALAYDNKVKEEGLDKELNFKTTKERKEAESQVEDA